MLLLTRLCKLSLTRIDPQVKVAEDKLVDHRYVKLRQSFSKLIDYHVADVLIKLCHDVQSLLVDVGSERLVDCHLCVELVEVVQHLSQETRSLEKVVPQEALGRKTHKSQEDQCALFTEGTHLLFYDRVVDEYFAYQVLIFSEYDHVLTQLL